MIYWGKRLFIRPADEHGRPLCFCEDTSIVKHGADTDPTAVVYGNTVVEKGAKICKGALVGGPTAMVVQSGQVIPEGHIYSNHLLMTPQGDHIDVPRVVPAYSP